MKRKLLEILTLTQTELLGYLTKELKSFGYKVQVTDFMVAGASPVDTSLPVIVAHLDTINTHRSARSLGYRYSKKYLPVQAHKEIAPSLEDIIFTDKYMMLSPEANHRLACLGADDRVGVVTVLELLRRGLRPNVLFTTDEEIGCKGTGKIINLEERAPQFLEEACMFVQVDRGNHEGFFNEMVFYDYDYDSNTSIYAELSKYFKLALGSFTDVAELGAYYGRPLVNLSASYENEHTRDEFIRLDWMTKNTDSLELFLKWVASQNDRSEWDYVKKMKRDYYYDYDYYCIGDDYSDFEEEEVDLSSVDITMQMQTVFQGSGDALRYYEEFTQGMNATNKAEVDMYIENAYENGLTVMSFEELDDIFNGYCYY